MTKAEEILGHLLRQIHDVRKADALSATIIMVYVAIDTMAFLSMPKGNKANGSKEFIAWVDKYMKTDLNQPYKYNGSDMWGARCGKLHAFSPDSNYAEKNNCKIYGYQDGPDHIYNAAESEKLVLISIDRLIQDFHAAFLTFLREALDTPELLALVNERLAAVCTLYNINEL